MPDLISGITGAIGLAKKAFDVAERLKNVELKEVIADLREQLVDAKAAAVDLKAENLTLRERLKRQEELAATAAAVVQRSNAYWHVTRSPGRDAGPFCQTCFQARGKLFSLNRTTDLDCVFGTHHCQHCNGYFTVAADG